MAAGFKQATVDASKVAATLTNYPAFVDLSRIGVTTQAEADSVRVYSNASKTTELAREIVSVKEMHVKISSLTTTTVIYVDYDGSRADYSVTDTYGRNAVWSDYYAVYHFQGAAGAAGKVADSTGNSRNLTENTSPSAITGKLTSDTSGGYDFDGLAGSTSSNSYDWLDRPGSDVLSDIGSSAFTFSCWWNPDINTTAAFPQINMEVNGAAGRPYSRVYYESDYKPWGGVETSAAGSNDIQSTVTISTGNWYYMAYGRSSSNYPFQFTNGTLVTSSSTESGAFSTTGAPFYINRRYNTSYGSARRYGDGKMDEVRLRMSYLDENWMDTEYNNQNDEATFWGTWTDVSTFTPQAMWFM
jgi:hypothetical protein